MGIAMRGEERVLSYNRHDLIETLKQNLEEHKKIVQEARQNFKTRLLEEIDKMVENIREKATVDQVIEDFHDLTTVNLEPPRDYSKEYEETIALFELAEGDSVELTAAEFKNYFLDEWHWARDFLVSNAPYSISARERRVRIRRHR